MEFIIIKRFLLYVLIGYILLVIYTQLIANSVIFQPPIPSYQDDLSKSSLAPLVQKGELKLIKLPLPSGATITGFYLPNPKAKYTILYSHGNAIDLGWLTPMLIKLRDEGFAVFSYDYPSYGTSSGTSNEKTSYESIRVAYDYLRNNLNIPGNKIIGYGNSLGAAITIELAQREPFAGLILISPFVSAFRVITQWPIILFDRYKNNKKIKKIHVPILIIHGTADRIVPFWHGKKMYELSNPPKDYLWVEGAGHNDLEPVAGERFWRKIKDFANGLAQ